MNYFFIGIAGTGMSAIAQYLKLAGNNVSGSDRQFLEGQFNSTQEALSQEGILCYPQNGLGINEDRDIVVVSTAIEETVPEILAAKQLGKQILKRSELLASIAMDKRTIAVGGTSGKSTTTAMLFDILDYAGLKPSIIGGAGLTRLINQGKIGNAAFGEGEWLIVEADESDGSIVQYHPEIGLLLNVDKDHQEIESLMELFSIFKINSSNFIVNLSHPLSASLSASSIFDFSHYEKSNNKVHATGFTQIGETISFYIDDILFSMNLIGKHNMENALAAIAVAASIGITYAVSSSALKNYKGIYRRHQVYGTKGGVTLIDDFAHNPIKCAKSIEACQPISDKLIAWFQPHGYGPTKFLRHDFIDELSKVIRPQDEIWMSEIYYAGGTAVKDISAGDLIEDLKSKGINAFFAPNREKLIDNMRPHFTSSTTLLLMGARDPSLGDFAKEVWSQL
jgi:UDP-N-acetylmuramate--alanine ligase